MEVEWICCACNGRVVSKYYCLFCFKEIIVVVVWRMYYRGLRVEVGSWLGGYCRYLEMRVWESGLEGRWWESVGFEIKW